MHKLNIVSHPEVAPIFNNYPDEVKEQMSTLRKLIIQTAEETEDITTIEETLKWGEPSYITKIGSTLRMDWKQKTPETYQLYFQCNSRLVATFRSLFGSTLNFEGKRAIVFKLNEKLPAEEVKYCIKAALTYHKVKHLPTLGI